MVVSCGSSWPWMKGTDVNFADPPIDPVNDRDSRPLVKDLIKKHRTTIDEVKEAIESDQLYDDTKHDDLWILRFVLSHKKKANDAIKAAMHCLEFRNKHKLDEEDIRAYPVGPTAKSEALKHYLKFCKEDAITVSLPDAKRGVVTFIDFSGVDNHKLIENVPEEDWLPVFLYVTEWSHQWSDYVTRTTGRLTRSVRLVDVSNFRFSQLNRETNARDMRTVKQMDDCYPQLLETIYICHSPAFIQGVFRLMRPMIPKRLLEKIDFITPNKNTKERNRLYKHLDEENLPIRFGGKYTTWPANFPLPN